jgi:hypothetical protein
VSLWDLFHRVGGWVDQRPRLHAVIDHLLRPIERITKIPIFGCHMCGQCVLHSTGLVCPMTCPKNLRNGPCGGVRSDEMCEVCPDMRCVWVRAVRRSQRLIWPQEIHDLRPPVDWSLQNTSSWLNYLTGRDQVESGCQPEPRSALRVLEEPKHG